MKLTYLILNTDQIRYIKFAFPPECRMASDRTAAFTAMQRGQSAPQSLKSNCKIFDLSAILFLPLSEVHCLSGPASVHTDEKAQPAPVYYLRHSRKLKELLCCLVFILFAYSIHVSCIGCITWEIKIYLNKV